MLQLVADDHCRAYMFWKEHAFREAVCVHVDAHLDVGEAGLTPARLEGIARASSEADLDPYRGNTYIPGMGLNCGNYLTPALLEGIVTHLICVLPAFIDLSLEGGRRELQAWCDLSLEEFRSLREMDGRLEGRLKGRRLTLCRPAQVRALVGQPLLLDIDLDYFVDEQRAIWQQPSEFLAELGPLQPQAITIAASVHGGYTPPGLVPELLEALGAPPLEVEESPLDRGSALYRLGRVSEALAELGSLDTAESRYLQGMIAYREGNYDRAVELLEQPYLRGAALYRAGRFVEAVEELHRAIKLEPTPDALHLFGLAWAGAGRPDQAARWLQTALRQAPGRLATQILRHDLGLETEVDVTTLRRRVPP